MEDKETRGVGSGEWGVGDKEIRRHGDKEVLSPTPHSPLPTPLVWLSLFLIPLIYFYPVLLGKVVLAPGDGWAQNFPKRACTGRILLEGELPLWIAYIFARRPLMASVGAGSGDPPNEELA